MKNCNILGKVAFVLVIVGALNWGLVGVFKFNLVTFLLGTMPMAITAVYALVGLAAIYLIFACCKKCKDGSCQS